MFALDLNFNREWYSYHFPELIKIVPDNYLFARLVKVIKNRKELSDDMHDQIEEIIMDSAKTKAVFDAAKSSMGMDISPIDLINIELFASRVIDMFEYRKNLHEYLKSKIDQVAPNLASLIGEQVAARLISHAGSLTNLAKYPASTIQILGAEKALFRALKTKSNTPKYGLIFHSSFIGRAGTTNKGRISRYLANKCAIASRIDCFSDIPTNVFGNLLHKQVDDRLEFFDSGKLPPKNVEVMKEAVERAVEARDEVLRKERKKKKKDKKKKKQQDGENGDGDVDMAGGAGVNEEVIENGTKNMTINEDEDMDITNVASDEQPKKKKKKKTKSENE
jgi:nucleolar protein 56